MNMNNRPSGLHGFKHFQLKKDVCCFNIFIIDYLAFLTELIELEYNGVLSVCHFLILLFNPTIVLQQASK